MSVIDIKRKKGESFEAMFRRFSRRLQSSGKMLTLRSNRFFTRKPNKNKTRASTLRRLEIGENREYLLRSGKLKETDLRTKKNQ